jgi:hypothetical protein
MIKEAWQAGKIADFGTLSYAVAGVAAFNHLLM